MILVLSPGGFCPKDRRQAEGLVQLHHEMEVGYSRLVTISTDNMLLTNEYRTGVGAHWTFLSDPGRKVQKDLDIAVCLANCYFAHDSSGFPILLLFFDAQSGRSCYPLDHHAGPVARTW